LTIVALDPKRGAMRVLSFTVLFALALGACSKHEASPSPAPSAAAPSAAPLSGPSAQSSDEPEIVATRMVSCTWTGKWTESFGEDVAEFSCKSNAPKALKQIVFWVYYYDKDGKLLERFLNSVEEPSGVVLEPGATKKLAIGKSKPHEPIYAKAIEVEAWRGSYVDGKRWENPDIAPENRPMQGPVPAASAR
jgi:uncharacterized protein YcfL